MKIGITVALLLLLSACAGGMSGGHAEMYGTITGGVESSHTTVSR